MTTRTTKPLPAWKTSRKDALTAWRASLSPEERAEYEAAWTAAKARSDERRAAKMALDRLVVTLALQGRTADEIATQTGRSKRWARGACARLGVGPGKPGYKRTPSVSVSDQTFEEISTVAAEQGEDVAETIARLLTYLFEENALHARRLLRCKPTRARPRTAT